MGVSVEGAEDADKHVSLTVWRKPGLLLPPIAHLSKRKNASFRYSGNLQLAKFRAFASSSKTTSPCAKHRYVDGIRRIRSPGRRHIAPPVRCIRILRELPEAFYSSDNGKIRSEFIAIRGANQSGLVRKAHYFPKRKSRRIPQCVRGGGSEQKWPSMTYAFAIDLLDYIEKDRGIPSQIRLRGECRGCYCSTPRRPGSGE